MPQIFYFESQADGSIICNARGVYYRVNPMFSRLLLVLQPRATALDLPVVGRGQVSRQGGRRFPEIFRGNSSKAAAFAGDRRRFSNRVPYSMLRLARKTRLASAWRAVRSVLGGMSSASIEQLFLDGIRQSFLVPSLSKIAGAGSCIGQIRVVGRSQYRMPLLAFGIRSPRVLARTASGRYSRKYPSEARACGLPRTRYQSGVARIFGLRTLAKAMRQTPADMSAFLAQLSGCHASPMWPAANAGCRQAAAFGRGRAAPTWASEQRELAAIVTDASTLVC